MTNPIHTEDFKFRHLRGISREGRPWIVALDAAAALHFPNPMEAVEALCPESVVVTIPQLGGPGILLTVIHMTDLFRLAEKSYRTDKAEFMAWVQGFAHRVCTHGQPRPWVLDGVDSIGDFSRPPAPAPAAGPAPRSGELIPILAAQIAGSQVNAVNARDLHQFLGVAKDFSDWIKVQIERARLMEHRDFEVMTAPPERGAGNRGFKVEYALTLDSAKHIAMMAGTDKGFEVRDYFIECERRAHQVQRVPQTLPEALRLAAELAEQRAALETRVQVLEPKAAFADAVAISSNHQDLDETARALGWGVLTFYTQLRKDRILMKKDHREHLPYQEWIDAGYFEVKEGTYEVKHRDGRKEVKNYLRTVVTGKGQAWLQAKFGKAKS